MYTNVQNKKHIVITDQSVVINLTLYVACNCNGGTITCVLVKLPVKWYPMSMSVYSLTGLYPSMVFIALVYNSAWQPECVNNWLVCMFEVLTIK